MFECIQIYLCAFALARFFYKGFETSQGLFSKFHLNKIIHTFIYIYKREATICPIMHAQNMFIKHVFFYIYMILIYSKIFLFSPFTSTYGGE